jgi:allophanate hydrolase subunit 2
MGLIVDQVQGLALLQDLGRPGHMHLALAPGGALVRAGAIAANRVARARDGAVVAEVHGALRVRAVAPCTVGIAEGGGARARRLRAGDDLIVASGRARVAYLALGGGIAAPERLGGRGAQLSAGIGAPLAAGVALREARDRRLDREASGDELGGWWQIAHRAAGAAVVVAVVPGPDVSAFAPGALTALTSRPYRIAPASDRVGTRLVGPALPRRPGHVERSRPLVRGALEVPRDGHPIALGPEHPTTGGYPVIAVIARAALDAFFAARLGGAVRLALD